MDNKELLIEPTDCLGDLLELIYPTEPEYTSMVITPLAWCKILCYINLIGDLEITGFGRCTVENKQLTVHDVRILRQEVKSASVDCDLDSMNEFLLSIPKEERGQWILDWHSHVNMGTFYSGTDTTNYESQWEARLKHQYPVMVVNKKQDITCGCYCNPNKIVPMSYTVMPIKGSLTKEQITEIYSQCYNDVAKLCSKAKVVTNYYRSSNYPFTGTTSWYDRLNDYDDYDSGYVTPSKKNEKEKDVEYITDTEDSISYWKEQAQRYRDVGNEKLADEYETIGNKLEIQSGLTKQDENNGRVQLNINDYCVSCGTYLVEPEEYDRGLCDDCWNAMTEPERQEWKTKYIN